MINDHTDDPCDHLIDVMGGAEEFDGYAIETVVDGVVEWSVYPPPPETSESIPIALQNGGLLLIDEDVVLSI